MRTSIKLVIGGLLAPTFLAAQEHEHRPGMVHPSSTAHSTVSMESAGQAAFGAIAEIVQLLEEDPETDWSKVNIEALRQHLIDMHDVTIGAVVNQENVPGGARFTVEGEGRTRDAVRRMSRAHAGMLNQTGEVRVTVEETPSGARLTILAADVSDARAVARLRGLGFIGMLTLGEHHGPHHLAMARGAGD